jgi:phosphogluconate dehydratase
MNPVVQAVTQRIRERSAPTRTAYLKRMAQLSSRVRGTERMGCANVAHAFAGLPGNDKFRVVAEKALNFDIVTA